MFECAERVKVKILAEKMEFIPVKAHVEDAGYDLFANLDEDLLLINPGERKLVSVGFKMSLPRGYEAQIRPRSGNAIKLGLTVLNTPGTIDCNYRGEVKVILFNSSDHCITINKMDKIAQMVINKLPDSFIEAVNSEEELGSSDRGAGGFGSTGTVKG